MTNNVVTMSGAPLLTYKDLMEQVRDRDDIEHVVVVVARKDGFMEIMYDRQSYKDIIMAAAALSAEASEMALETIVETE